MIHYHPKRIPKCSTQESNRKPAENPSLSWAGVDWILQSIKCLSCITHIFMDDELNN